MPPLQISCRSSTYLLSYNPLLGLLFSYFSNPISRPSPFSSSSASSSSSSSSPWFSILRTALATNNLLLGKSAHACIIKSVQISDRFLSNNLINMYSKCGSPSYARNVFDITPDRDLVTWNSILAAYALSAEFEVYFIQEGFNLFRLLLGFGVPTSRLTLAPVLKLCLFSGYAWASEAVHGYALKIGLEWDAFVSGALVNIYLKFGRTKNARLLFDEMQERDVVLWNLMLKAYVQMGLGKEMFSLFSEFHRSGLGPDDASVHCVLSGTNEYNSEEARKFMEQVHAYAVKLNLYDDIDNSDVDSEILPDNRTIDDPDLSSSSDYDDDAALRDLQTESGALVADLEAIHVSFQIMQSRTAATEESLGFVEREKEDALKINLDLSKRIEEVSSERDWLRDEINGIRVCLKEKEDEFGQKMEEVRNEVEVSRRRIEELENERREMTEELEKERRGKNEELETERRERAEELEKERRERSEELEDERRERIRIFSENLSWIEKAKECLLRIIESVDEGKVGDFSIAEKEEGVKGEIELGEESRAFSVVIEVSKLASMAETKVSKYQEMRKKEKRELENSVVSLTEENRDNNSLLRIALVEKEAVEKSLNRLKGNSEQKRVPLLQFGLQRVGFGFMMGNASNEQSLDSSDVTTASNKSDGSECEEEVVSLASTVERIMKNLRIEISQLRRSLEESRSDTERLQSLTEKQAQIIAENTFYIKDLEDRERVLAQNVEELLMEIKETEEEAARWREACELEVEAGKNVIEEHDKVAAILQQELEKKNAALEISNSKLKLKEDLAAAAMAAQAAAERSLQLADSRAAGLRERIEELTRQLEETENREQGRRRVRHICWPWRALKVNPANSISRVRNVRRMLPEMQALLQNV